MKKINFLIIFFFLSLPAYSDEQNTTSTFSIGFIDIAEDIRYSTWGIHPVDIRSKLMKEKRSIDGATLGLGDIKPFQRIAKLEFSLETVRVDNESLMAKAAINMADSNLKVILLDGPEKALSDTAEALKNKNVILINVSDTSNSLRNENCKKNLFHTAPSMRMYTDAIGQYLADKKWRSIVILSGPLEEDRALTESFKNSAYQYGLKIIEEKSFLLGNDPRSRDQNDLDFLTGKLKYDAIFISDTHGEFSLKVPFATVRPAGVFGSSGLKPVAWHWSYLRHGAPQIHGRFERKFLRRMNSRDWGAWVAMRAIAEAIVRGKVVDAEGIANYFTSNDFTLDGSKGSSLNFREWNRQLRQPIFLTTENWVTAVAPIEGFIHREENMDTLGVDSNNTKCKVK